MACPSSASATGQRIRAVMVRRSRSRSGRATFRGAPRTDDQPWRGFRQRLRWCLGVTGAMPRVLARQAVDARVPAGRCSLVQVDEGASCRTIFAAGSVRVPSVERALAYTPPRTNEPLLDVQAAVGSDAQDSSPGDGPRPGCRGYMGPAFTQRSRCGKGEGKTFHVRQGTSSSVKIRECEEDRPWSREGWKVSLPGPRG